MKTVLALVLGCVALPVAAQNNSGSPTTSPGPQSVPTPNINAGGNPTAPAQLPVGVVPNNLQPPYGSGGPASAWSGGVIPSDKTAPGPQDEAARRKAEERERGVAEPNVSPSPSSPESQVVSPNGPGEQPNPEAPQNTPPQPGTGP